LKNIKDYLTKANIYTKKINVGEKVDTSYFSVVQTLKTENENLHRTISEVILPPFCIKYINGFGKVKEKLICKGKVIVYSNKN
jgi:hypothetical protein